MHDGFLSYADGNPRVTLLRRLVGTYRPENVDWNAKEAVLYLLISPKFQISKAGLM